MVSCVVTAVMPHYSTTNLAASVAHDFKASLGKGHENRGILILILLVENKIGEIRKKLTHSRAGSTQL